MSTWWTKSEYKVIHANVQEYRLERQRSRTLRFPTAIDQLGKSSRKSSKSHSKFAAALPVFNRDDTHSSKFRRQTPEGEAERIRGFWLDRVSRPASRAMSDMPTSLFTTTVEFETKTRKVTPAARARQHSHCFSEVEKPFTWGETRYDNALPHILVKAN